MTQVPPIATERLTKTYNDTVTVDARDLDVTEEVDR